MLFTQASRQLTLRIALFAMLMAALMPTLSHALQAGGSKAWIEVCTVVGAKWVTPENSNPDEQAPASMASMDHCPYCSTQGQLRALTLSLTLASASSALQFDVPRLFLLAPLTHHAWARALPRAPPRGF